MMNKKTRKIDPDLFYANEDPFGLPVTEQVEMLWFECINRNFPDQNERNACLYWQMEVGSLKPNA